MTRRVIRRKCARPKAGKKLKAPLKYPCKLRQCECSVLLLGFRYGLGRSHDFKFLSNRYFMNITKETLDQLREIRLEYWKRLRFVRDNMESSKAHAEKHDWQFDLDGCEATCNMFIKRIQALNDFFDTSSGDTAEKDYEVWRDSLSASKI